MTRAHRAGVDRRAAYLLFCLIIGWSLSAGTACRAASVTLTRTTAAGVPMLVLTVDLNDSHVKVTGMVMPNGHSDSFIGMVRRAHPTAAVTGTYFSVDSLIPIGDIVVNGKLVHSGGSRTALCLTGDNQVEFIKPRGNMDWSGYDFVCCAGPRLVGANRIVLNPRAEGFHDRDLLGSACRLAVGVTRGNKLIFAATRDHISLGRLAMAMKALGCMDAMNLDAGSSLGVYKGGQTVIPPSRRLTNLILVYDDRVRYERFKYRLSPVLARAH